MKKFIISMLITAPIPIIVGLFWNYDTPSALFGVVFMTIIALTQSVYEIMFERKEKKNDKKN